MKLHLTPQRLRAIAALALSLAGASAQAQDSGTGFRFRLGLDFISGLNDFGDKISVNNPNISVKQNVPVGLALGLSYGFGGGWAAGLTVGPAILGIGDVSLHVVPVGLDVRYRFGAEASSPYVRLGVEKANAGGDFIKSGKAGGVAAVGMEFGKASGFGWGVELGYRSAEVIVKATPGHREAKAQPYKAVLGLYVAF